MLHPSQFQVGEAWIVFQLNDQPLQSEKDGDFDFFALMDAASCFILASAPVAATQSGPTPIEAKRLLKEGQVHKKRWPKTLFVPSELAAQAVVAEVDRLGIGVVRVAEAQLSPIIGEAQEGFRARFGGRGAH